MGSGTWTTKDDMDGLRRAERRANDPAATEQQRAKAREDIEFWKRSLAERR